MIIETPPIRFRRIITESCSFGRVYVWLPKDSKPYVTQSLPLYAREVLTRQRGCNLSLSSLYRSIGKPGPRRKYNFRIVAIQELNELISAAGCFVVTHDPDAWTLEVLKHDPGAARPHSELPVPEQSAASEPAGA